MNKIMLRSSVLGVSVVGLLCWATPSDAGFWQHGHFHGYLHGHGGMMVGPTQPLNLGAFLPGVPGASAINIDLVQLLNSLLQGGQQSDAVKQLLNRLGQHVTPIDSGTVNRAKTLATEVSKTVDGHNSLVDRLNASRDKIDPLTGKKRSEVYPSLKDAFDKVKFSETPTGGGGTGDRNPPPGGQLGSSNPPPSGS